jgi:hypothetical protein
MVPEPVVGGNFNFTFSGFGLKPGAEVFACGKYGPSGVSVCSVVPVVPTVGADGTISELARIFPCIRLGSKVSFLFIQTTTASGTFFERDFPPPSGC